jgi:hypothetical protein
MTLGHVAAAVIVLQVLTILLLGMTSKRRIRG